MSRDLHASKSPNCSIAQVPDGGRAREARGILRRRASVVVMRDVIRKYQTGLRPRPDQISRSWDRLGCSEELTTVHSGPRAYNLRRSGCMEVAPPAAFCVVFLVHILCSCIHTLVKSPQHTYRLAFHPSTAHSLATRRPHHRSNLPSLITATTATMSTVTRTQPIAFSRSSSSPSPSSNFSSPPSSPPSRPSFELSTSPSHPSPLAKSPQQHPCPHLSELVKCLYNAYNGGRR